MACYMLMAKILGVICISKTSIKEYPICIKRFNTFGLASFLEILLLVGYFLLRPEFIHPFTCY